MGDVVSLRKDASVLELSVWKHERLLRSGSRSRYVQSKEGMLRAARRDLFEAPMRQLVSVHGRRVGCDGTSWNGERAQRRWERESTTAPEQRIGIIVYCLHKFCWNLCVFDPDLSYYPGHIEYEHHKQGTSLHLGIEDLFLLRTNGSICWKKRHRRGSIH